jgi:1-acyl-sn-glycerol-3-phosphate acyltransferase
MNPMVFFIRYVRSLFFWAGLVASLLIWAFICLSIAWLIPLKKRFRFLMQWNRFITWWVGFSCGVHYEVTGLENFDSGAKVVLSNHQSAWETISFNYIFLPICPVLKQELLLIPIFGWALRLMKPIPINRSQRSSARKQVLTQGLQRLQEDGLSILIFPEGTRVREGEERRFSASAAELAIAAGVPIIPVAHNAGKFWPASSLIKTPGTINVTIFPAIDSLGREPRELIQQAEQIIKSAQLGSNI